MEAWKEKGQTLAADFDLLLATFSHDTAAGLKHRNQVSSYYKSEW